MEMMNNNLISIKNTHFKEYFSSEIYDEVFLLDTKDANLFWHSYIGENTTSYFNLPNDNWIIKEERIFLAEWITYYNEDNNISISTILKNQISCDNDATIWFCMSKELILKSNWKVFLEHWDCFIAIDDDCPIILIENEAQSLLFTSIGGLYKIIRKEK